MSQWKLFWQTLRLFPKSIRFVAKNGLSWVYFASLSFAFILVVMLFLLKGEIVQGVEEWILDTISGVFSLDISDSKATTLEVEGLLMSSFRWILNGALHLLGLWVQLKVYKPLVLIVLSPVFAWLMERSLELQGGNPPHFEWARFLRSIARGIRFALLLTMLEWMVFSVLALIVFVIPILVPAAGPLLLFAPIISFGISSWFYGAAIMDYAWELYDSNSTKSIRQSWTLRGAVLGVGVPFSALTMVPFWTLGLGPVFAGIVCVVMGSFLATEAVS